MVEGGAKMLSEDVILDALFTAHREMQKILDLQDELRKALGKPKRTVVAPVVDTVLQKGVRDVALPKIRTAMETAGKHERSDAVRQVRTELLAALAPEFPDREREIKAFFEDAHYDAVRGLIVEQRKRIDGRGLTDIRPITSEVGVLPRTHGSALFTRGETQALVVATLGTSSDEQKIDALERRGLQEVHAALQFPAVQRRRGEVPARPGPAGDRSRGARRARGRGRDAATRQLSPTRCASSPRSSNRTARRRWRSCAAARSR